MTGTFAKDTATSRKILLRAISSSPYSLCIHLSTVASFSQRLRPVYFNPNDTETLLYTGRRWFVAAGRITNNDTHAYWDNTFLNTVRFISEVTDDYEPTGPLKWFGLPYPFSIGNYGPFGFNYQVFNRYECLAVDCKINNVCGLGDDCDDNQTLENGNVGGKCNWCASTFQAYGHFCEFRNFTTVPV
jgi:hypothetical protein